MSKEEFLEQDSEIEQPVNETLEQEELEQEELEQEETLEQEESIVEEEVALPLSNEVEIEGLGKVTFDDIKEWKQGHLRQSDYTKKTQVLAREKQEAKDALELYDYLKANPDIAMRLRGDSNDLDDMGLDSNIESKVANLTPEMQRLEMLEQRIAQDELVKEIEGLKNKYPDFDEIKVLNEAHQRGIDDLEFIYKATKENTIMDVEKIKAEAVAEAKKQIMEELNRNSDSTATVVGNGKAQVVTAIKVLTPEQKRVAMAMGVSEEDYLKWI